MPISEKCQSIILLFLSLVSHIKIILMIQVQITKGCLFALSFIIFLWRFTTWRTFVCSKYYHSLHRANNKNCISMTPRFKGSNHLQALARFQNNFESLMAIKKMAHVFSKKSELQIVFKILQIASSDKFLQISQILLKFRQLKMLPIALKLLHCNCIKHFNHLSLKT